METSTLIQEKTRLRVIQLDATVGMATFLLIGLLISFQGMVPIHADPGILYVDGASGQDIDICGTITLPCQSISYALNSLANDNDTIVVAQGIYTENLIVDKGVALMGGYEPISWARNITLYETIINGNRVGSSVIFKAGANEAVLDGFTITDGHSCWLGGGGIRIQDANPSVVNNIITNNRTDGSGGGIYVKDSSPSITGNIITENTADIGGGGIYTRDSSPSIVGNSITSNVTFNGGGGIEVRNSSPSIEGNVISSNIGGGGGGIRVQDNSSPTIENNTITNNEANTGGGILVMDRSSPTIRNNDLTDNIAIWGGGMHLIWHSSPTVDGNTIKKNLADDYGGGILVSLDSSPFIRNNTIADNSSKYGGGINIWNNSSPTIEANTFTSNTAEHGGGIFVWEYSTPTITGNVFEFNIADVNGGAMWTSHTSMILDEEGNPLPTPDTLNTYTDNVPDDVYPEPEPPPEPEPEPGRELHVPVDYPTIQAAINAANDWDTIIVAPGTYTENLDFLGKNITVTSEDPEDPNVVQNTIIDGGANGSVVTFRSQETAVAVLAGFTIKNGFAGSGGGIQVIERSQPTIAHNIISGNSAYVGGGINCWNSAPNIISNTVAGNTAGAGCGIHAGHSCLAVIRDNVITENSSPDAFGGGILVKFASPVVENNIITGNTAGRGMGGGIFLGYSSSSIFSNTIIQNVTDPGCQEDSLEGSGGGIASDTFSSPIIEYNIIQENCGGAHGGGVYLEFGFAEVRNNVIENNVARCGGGIMSALYSFGLIENNTIQGNRGRFGGGINIGYATPIVYSNTISGNSALDEGGGIFVKGDSSTSIKANSISENEAEMGGAIIIMEGGSPTVAENAITANEARDTGGGIVCLEGCFCAIINNMIAENAAHSVGGIDCFNAFCEIFNNTIARNSCPNDSNGILCESCIALVTNTVLWDNDGHDIKINGTSSVTITYSDIEQGWTGIGNIAANPLFLDPGSGDYHLRFGSPCIDTGTDTSLHVDFEEDRRPFDGNGNGIDKYDMGADEWVGTIQRVYLPLTCRNPGQ